MEKENKRLKVLLGMLCVFAMGLCVYFAYTVYKLNMNSSDCTSNEVKVDENKYDELNLKELDKFGKGDINIIKTEYSLDHSFNLEINGKINVDYLDYISNIEDAKDILLYISPTDEYVLYILTKSGDIYKYDISNIDSSNLNATRVDNYNNIQKMISYKTRRGNSGGCDYLIVIDNNGKYYELTSFCV